MSMTVVAVMAVSVLGRRSEEEVRTMLLKVVVESKRVTRIYIDISRASYGKPKLTALRTRPRSCRAHVFYPCLMCGFRTCAMEVIGYSLMDDQLYGYRHSSEGI